MIGFSGLRQSCTISAKKIRFARSEAATLCNLVPGHVSTAQRSFSLFNRARVVAVGRHNPHSTFLDKIKLKVSRQALLIRGEFLKQREISVGKGAGTAAPSKPVVAFKMSLAEVGS